MSHSGEGMFRPEDEVYSQAMEGVDRAAEHVHEAYPDAPDFVHSPEFQDAMAQFATDVVMAAEEHELMHGEKPDIADPEVMIEMAGGEEVVREKYGDSFIIALRQIGRMNLEGDK